MKKFLLSFLLCSSFFSFAQDWNPFPLGQKSLYQYPFSNGVAFPTLNQYYIDSVIDYGSYQVFHFDYTSPGFGNCYGVVSNNQPQSTGFKFYDDDVRPDSIIQRGDTLLFKYSSWNISTYNDSITFLPNIELGNSWFSSISGASYNKLRFTCTSITTATVGSFVDSVKVILIQAYNNATPVSSDFDTKQLILSKNYGFKKFVSFYTTNKFSIPLFSINQNLPSFTDYFNLNSGDVIIWKEFFDDPDIFVPSSTYYHKDSIISVLHTQDSTVYNISRENDNGSQGNSQRIFLKNKLEKFFAASTGNIVPGDLQGYGDYDLYQPSGIFLTNLDTIFNRKFTQLAYSFDSINCTSYEVLSSIDYHFGTYYGLTAYSYNYSSGAYTDWTIEGSTINGIQEGVLWSTLVTGINNLENNPNIKIYPNPSKSGNFTLESDKAISLEIVSVSGQIVFSQSINQPKTEIKTNLPKGLYFVKLSFENKQQSVLKMMITD